MVSNELLAKFLIVVDQLEALSYLRINLVPSLDNNAAVFAKAFVTTPDVEAKTSNNNLKVMELEAVVDNGTYYEIATNYNGLEGVYLNEEEDVEGEIVTRSLESIDDINVDCLRVFYDANFQWSGNLLVLSLEAFPSLQDWEDLDLKICFSFF